MGAIKPDTSLEDLERFSITVRQGYAWAGSSYRRPGYGVRMAAEDTENLRQIFLQRFGKPATTAQITFGFAPVIIPQGDGTFKEMAKAYGLDVKDGSLMAAFCDYDRDGDVDLSAHSESSGDGDAEASVIVLGATIWGGNITLSAHSRFAATASGERAIIAGVTRKVRVRAIANTQADQYAA